MSTYVLKTWKRWTKS